VRFPDIEKLKTIQEKIGISVLINDNFLPQIIKSVGGIDVSFLKAGKNELAKACAVVLSYPDGKIIEYQTFICEIEFPYIPELLAFRELKPLWFAWKKVKNQPDLWIIDGQGIAHPRGAGIASHFGVLTGEIVIGCAKGHLFGDYEEPPFVEGGKAELKNKGSKIGWVFRPSLSKKFWFISPGHKITPDKALEIVKNMAFTSSMPEPVRIAHIYSKFKE
jgi:deoxyribonuclease V